jgi:hypothetical protein
LQPIFEDLKEMQRKFRDAKLTKDHRAKVWDKLDKAFKSIKERRFGPNTSDDRPPVERLQRRYDGLMSAIDKMEKSIHRDDEELDFQKRKVEASEGQLEAQIRQAKIVMIEERIRSKREKLNEMTTTKVDLDRRMDSQREKEAKRMEQEKVEEAKRMAQDKIAQEIKAAASARETESDKLDKAAEAIKSEKQPKEADKPKEEPAAAPQEESFLDAISTTLGESLQGALDTALAVAQVAGEKLSDAVVDIVENISEKVQEAMKPTEAADAPAAEEAAATTTAETTETVAEATEKPATDDAPTATDEVKPTEEEEA